MPNAPDVLGALFALDGRKQGQIAESDLLWKIPGRTVGRSQPLLVGDRLYAVDDGGTLWIVDARTGQDVGKQKLGRIMFGSMVYGDGKIFVGEATGRWYVLKPTDKGVEVIHQARLTDEEILGSPIISHGRIYLPTNAALYCIGLKDATPSSDPLPRVRQKRRSKRTPRSLNCRLFPSNRSSAAGDKLPHDGPRIQCARAIPPGCGGQLVGRKARPRWTRPDCSWPTRRPGMPRRS